tara:strand:- start:152 stop:667 length:516 start_codon:yes stop_codon:yes gene_type:complete
MAPFFVLVPLIAYIPMFIYELYISFRRIGKPLDKGGEYLHATWEVTHTFLILSINYFVWLYSDAVVDVGRAAFGALLLFGAAFIFRAVLYTQLFYIKSSVKPNLLVDWMFALTHVVMAASLFYTVAVAVSSMIREGYEPNQTFLPLLWPGIILMLPLVSVPLYFLYKTKSR